TARLWLVRAAGEVEAAGAKPEKAALSLMAREVTEDACRRVAETIERAMGIPAHIGGSFTDRMLRDLRLFLCQAAPDAKRNRAASTLIGRRARPEHL
ncbi:MAG: acyl-CoA dehydrogenase, partial [Alteriqipengyuania sp.]